MGFIRGLVTYFIQNAMQSVVYKNLSYFILLQPFFSGQSSMRANNGSNELSFTRHFEAHRSFIHRTEVYRIDE